MFSSVPAESMKKPPPCEDVAQGVKSQRWRMRVTAWQEELMLSLSPILNGSSIIGVPCCYAEWLRLNAQRLSASRTNEPAAANRWIE